VPIFLIAIPAFFLLPAWAFADVPVPSFFGFGAPFFLSLQTVGALFAAIIAIEAVVFLFGLRIKWKAAFLASTIANLASSAFGLLVAGIPIAIFLAFGVAALLYTYFKRRDYPPAARFGLPLAPVLLTIPWWAFTWFHARALEPWAFYGSLVPAFLLTVVLEAPLIEKRTAGRQAWQWTLLGNTGSYLLLLGVLLLLPVSPTENPMLTIDYVDIAAESNARDDNGERVMELIQLMRDFNPDDQYEFVRELRLGQILALHGDRRHAAEILDYARTYSHHPSLWTQEIKDQEDALERLLAHDSPSTNSFAPPEGKTDGHQP